ncbi:hypothetical protein [Thioclava sp. GXIMD2076]|uniref:hypothetical protein n=1 Tax=Thioclava sp. GXIMD2076 TaxID=3131931 RepID=UPI0030D29F27
MPSIIISGANASKSLDFDLPFDDIAYLNFFEDSDLIERNLGTGAAAVTSGTATVGSGYVSLTGSEGFLQTDAVETEEMTIISVSRAVSIGTGAARPLYISNYASSTLGNGGTSIYANGTAVVTGATYLNNAGATANVSSSLAATPQNWSMKALRVDAESLLMEDFTTGLSGSQAITYARDLNANPYRIGWGYATSFDGNSDHASACIVNRRIADDELNEIAALMRRRAALFGITV